MTATASVFMSRVDQFRARLARFDPGQARDGHGRWSDGTLSADAYAGLYGEAVDEQSIDLGDGQQLTARFFESGDGHLVIDRADGSSLVLVEVESPTQMHDIAYGIEDLLDTEIDDEPGNELMDDASVGGAYLSVNANLELSIAAAEDDGRGADLVEEQARDLAAKMHELADSWESHFDDEYVEVVAHMPLQVGAKFNPDQPRDGRGRWGDGIGVDLPELDPKRDKLKLADRIDLGQGESLRSTDSVNTDWAVTPMAVVDTPAGIRLRIGVGIADDDKSRWTASNRGSTADLDEAGIGELRGALERMDFAGQEGKQHIDALNARADRLEARQRELMMRRFPDLSQPQKDRLFELDRQLADIDAEIRGIDETNAEEIQLPVRRAWRMDRLEKLNEQRSGVQRRRDELAGDPVPLAGDDLVELAAVTDQLESVEDEIIDWGDGRTLAAGVIRSDWADIAYETRSSEGGTSHAIGIRPRDAGLDWQLSSEGETPEPDGRELRRLLRVLNELTDHEVSNG